MNKAAKTAIAIALILPFTPLSASAQPDDRWQGGPDHRDWDAAGSYHDAGDHHDRSLKRDDYVHRGSDGRYYCRRDDGTTGLVIGGIGGALIGGAVGGDALGALLGGASGAVLGSSIDRGEVHCR